MEKLGKIYRSTLEKEFKAGLLRSGSIFLVKHAGLKASELSQLRNNLSGAKCKIIVTKNSLASRMLKEAQLEELSGFLNGQVAFIFTYDDPVSVCKVISGFIKEHAALEFSGGVLEKRLITKNDLKALAEMPSKEMLRAELVAVINSPLSRLASSLKHNLNKLVYYMEQRKDKITK